MKTSEVSREYAALAHLTCCWCDFDPSQRLNGEEGAVARLALDAHEIPRTPCKGPFPIFEARPLDWSFWSGVEKFAKAKVPAARFVAWRFDGPTHGKVPSRDPILIYSATISLE